ncbi:MAG: phosphoribosyltransferase [Thermoplasmataceae archaeon]|jgi:hypoxanthine phosphoribosyltransferase
MEFKTRMVTWDEIFKWCVKIRDTVISEYDPDYIIGLSRGGLVPARLLSDMLWIKDLYAVKTEHWGLTATRDGTPTIKKTNEINVRGRNVIIVDDITDTGASMKLAHDYVLSLKPKALKTATMLHITHSQFKPDYSSEIVEDSNWTWFIFPWNVYEDTLNLVSRVLISPMTTESIKRSLKDTFELDIDSTKLEELLNYFSKRKKIVMDAGLWTIPNPAK